MPVPDYSTTPSSNVTISGINVAENCPAGNLNGAFRQMMADIKVMYNGLPDTAAYVLRSGGSFITNPTYSGRGGYLHFNDTTLLSGRIFVQPLGLPDPAGIANGDLILEF